MWGIYAILNTFEKILLTTPSRSSAAASRSASKNRQINSVTFDEYFKKFSSLNCHEELQA